MANEKVIQTQSALTLINMLGRFYRQGEFYGYFSEYESNRECMGSKVDSVVGKLFDSLQKLNKYEFNVSIAPFNVLYTIPEAIRCLKYKHEVPVRFNGTDYTHMIELIEQFWAVNSHAIEREIRYRMLLSVVDGTAIARLSNLIKSAWRFAALTSVQVNEVTQSSLNVLKQMHEIRKYKHLGVSVPVKSELVPANQISNFTALLTGYQTVLQNLHHRATQLPFYPHAFVLHTNDFDPFKYDNRKMRANNGYNTHYRLHTEFCYILSRTRQAIELMQQLDLSQIEPKKAELWSDISHGYERYPQFGDSDWSDCYKKTVRNQYGFGVPPGLYGPPECEWNLEYEFKRPRKAREPNGFRNPNAIGKELKEPIDDVCNKSLTELEPELPTISGAIEKGITEGVVFAIPAVIREALIAYNVLTPREAELLQLGVNVAMVAVNPDSWGPLFVAIAVKTTLQKMGVSSLKSRFVGGLFGFGCTIYKDGVNSFTDMLMALAQFQTSFWSYEFLDWGAKQLRFTFFGHHESEVIQESQTELNSTPAVVLG